MQPPALSKWTCHCTDIAAQISMNTDAEMKSRTPKRGFWLMRGAQPATNAGARPYAGSPIPAFLTIQKGW